MRVKPFSFALSAPPATAATKTEAAAPGTTNAPATEAPDWKNSVVDLSELLQSKGPEPATETKTEAKETTTTTTETKTEATTTEQKPNEPSATFEEGFEKFKENAAAKLSDFVENPEELATMFVKFGNIGRVILLPSVYTRVMFPEEERKDLKAMLEKRVAAEKANKAPDFNNYEKRLLAKYERLEAAKEQISYTETEIKWLAKIVAKRIQDLTVAAWMEKYDWLIALGYLEFKHASSVLSQKAEDFAMKKLGV